MKNVPPRPDDASSVSAREKRSATIERFPKPPRERPRLPDGARFDVVYDATEKRWTGTLIAGGHTVSGRAGGVFTLLGVLDQKLRSRLRPGLIDEPEHSGMDHLACAACGTDSTVGCLEATRR